MIIKAVRVERFCCIYDETLICEPLTALVGPNGCGKSTFLRAIGLFYSASPHVSIDDFYDRDAAEPIRITVTFTRLSREARELFAPYLDGDDLMVTRILALSEDRTSARFHGFRLLNPDFGAAREGTASEIRTKYAALRQDQQYVDLPAANSKEAALSSLRAWEEAHPDVCVRLPDDGQFFGFAGVAQGYLGRFTRFIHIPAVRDASGDAAEAKGSVVSELVDLVVRRTLAERDDLRLLQVETQGRYDEIMSPENLTELGALGDQLSKTLKTYAPDASVDLSFQKATRIELPMPKTQIRLIEHGYSSSVAHTGHGLQRSLILTMLQHLAASQAAPPGNAASVNGLESGQQSEQTLQPDPDLVLAIEEPELYQHPSRARHLARILLDLARGTSRGVFSRTQVIYGTHSELFVGLDRFEQVRVLRKVCGEDGKPHVTRIAQATMLAVAEELRQASDEHEPAHHYDEAAVRSRLTSILTTSMSEGFFADVVVLVEGIEDRAAFMSTAHVLGRDLDGMGIVVLPCGGKPNLGRPLVIFRRFGIPTYVVWDGDAPSGATHAVHNRRLLRLVGQPAEDLPNTQVDAHFACFSDTISDILRQEFGDSHYERVLTECKNDGTVRREGNKNPLFIDRLFTTGYDSGLGVPTLEAILERIIALRNVPDVLTTADL